MKLECARWAIVLMISIGFSVPSSAQGTLARKPAARIGSVNGTPTMLLDGKPFFVIGAQCDIWRSTHQDDKTIAFFDGYRDMHATTVSVGIPWSKVEPTENGYDFRFVDWFVKQAESHDLKLVLNLFNTNICGKVAEGAGPSAYPQYTPSYILDQPNKYHRMVLPYPYRYVDGGPPMCPNDPNTLDRERRLVQKLAAHLRDTDLHNTVIMLQLNNEFYYQQWDGARPDYGSPAEKAVRCQCANCLAKWDAAKYATGEEFMFKSFAQYARGLSDGIASVYRLPMYLNSPWWPPYIVPIFLEACPNIDFIGIDGVHSPWEPGIFSLSQISRNLPFAAENPTENAEVRLNLDVLPYYTLIGRPGIGNLLWECHEPFTVVDDLAAKRRYGSTIQPIKDAMEVIGNARGTGRIAGWYARRDIAPGLKTDATGNFIEVSADKPIVTKTHTFVREGTTTRPVDADQFDMFVGGLTIHVSGSAAGIIVQKSPREWIVVSAACTLHFRGKQAFKAEYGKFQGSSWVSGASLKTEATGDSVDLTMDRPGVVRVRW